MKSSKESNIRGTSTDSRDCYRKGAWAWEDESLTCSVVFKKELMDTAVTQAREEFCRVQVEPVSQRFYWHGMHRPGDEG